MEKNRKGHLLIAASLISIMAISAVSAVIYFNRTIHHGFSVTGIQADVLNPSFAGYNAKQVASDLTNNQVALTIYAENFYDVWLNVTWSSDAVGLAVTMTGQYYEAYWYNGAGLPGGSVGEFDANGTSFAVPMNTEYVVMKHNMMWQTLVQPPTGTGNMGGCLVLTFSLDTEQVLVPGSYDLALTFQMGFV